VYNSITVSKQHERDKVEEFKTERERETGRERESGRGKREERERESVVCV